VHFNKYSIINTQYVGLSSATERNYRMIKQALRSVPDQGRPHFTWRDTIWTYEPSRHRKMFTSRQWTKKNGRNGLPVVM